MKKFYLLFLILTLSTIFITSCSKFSNKEVEAYANNITQTVQAPISPGFQVINQQSPDSEALTINTIHEDNDHYMLFVKYPSTCYTELNKIIENLIYPYINSYKEAIKLQNTYDSKLEFLIDYQTIKYTNSIITFKFNIYSSLDSKTMFPTIKTLTFNLDNGKMLLIENIFKPNSAYIEILSQKSVEFLDKSIAIIEQSFINFALTEDNLILYFDINSLNEETEILKIPYTDLADMLLPFDSIGEQETLPTAPTTRVETIPETIPETSVKPNNVPEIDATTSGKLIAITFDDGPNPKTTPLLLDGLKDRNVKATFFMLGLCIENNPDIIKRMFDEGHSIGNHSYSHQNFVKINENTMKIQYNKPNEILNTIIGTDATLFRPPFGSYNDSTKEFSSTPIVLWSIDPKDWKYKDAESVSNHIIEKAHDGDIILLHDIYPTSVEAAFKAIDVLQKKGFTFVTVDELIRRDHYEPKPGEVFRFKRKK